MTYNVNWDEVDETEAKSEGTTFKDVPAGEYVLKLLKEPYTGTYGDKEIPYASLKGQISEGEYKGTYVSAFYSLNPDQKFTLAQIKLLSTVLGLGLPTDISKKAIDAWTFDVEDKEIVAYVKVRQRKLKKDEMIDGKLVKKGEYIDDLYNGKKQYVWTAGSVKSLADYEAAEELKGEVHDGFDIKKVKESTAPTNNEDMGGEDSDGDDDFF